MSHGGDVPYLDSDPRSPELWGQEAQIPSTWANGSDSRQGHSYSHSLVVVSVDFTVVTDLVSILKLEDGAHRVSSQSCSLCYIFKRSSHLSACSFWMVWAVMGPVHRMAMCSPPHLHGCKMVSLVWHSVVQDPVLVGQTLCKPSIVVLTETLQKGMVNPNLEYVLIPVRMSCCPFHSTRGSV